MFGFRPREDSETSVFFATGAGMERALLVCLCVAQERRNWMRSTFKSAVGALILCTVMLALTGCSGQPLSTREKGTLGGAGIGAATGAIIGAAVGAPGAGAAIGGAMGGVGGYAIGNSMQNQEAQQTQTQGQISQQQQEIERQRRELQQLKQQSQTE
jgi:uncharacterized protein YcfJ